ncbi:Rrf2 family transcriptional regulator [Clostridium sp. D33t1_170424_F3]|uniref:RrF2 family transcriptional regulator n=1 Tax=Clostridium sp. D33t1_170424_F3 TaxID=2787099 RepID=UPI0018AB68F8
MQLNAKTDHAIRIVIYLAGHKGITSAQDLSKAVGIPKQYVFSIVNELRGVGIVASTRGVNGGFYLAKAPDKITLWDIAEITETTMQIARVDVDNGISMTVMPEYRLVDGVYRALQHQLEAILKVASIAEILRCAGRSPCYGLLQESRI